MAYNILYLKNVIKNLIKFKLLIQSKSIRGE